MLAGFISGRIKLFPSNSSSVISQFVFLVAMPSFIFISLSTIPVAHFFNWTYLAALGGGMFIIFAGSIIVAKFVFKQSLTTQSLHALSAMFSSTAYIGLPLILIIFGEEGLVPGIIGSVITVAIFMPLTVILIEIDKGEVGRKTVLATLLQVIQNPLLIATAAGLLLSASGIELAMPLVDFFSLLGDAFIPCALFAAGLFTSGCKIAGDVTEISWVVLVKLIMHPLATWWLAFHVFELEGILPVIAVLQAALPSGVPVFVIAQHYDSFVSRSSAVIALSTAVSILTLPVVLFLLLRTHV